MTCVCRGIKAAEGRCKTAQQERESWQLIGILSNLRSFQ